MVTGYLSSFFSLGRPSLCSDRFDWLIFTHFHTVELRKKKKKKMKEFSVNDVDSIGQIPKKKKETHLVRKKANNVNTRHEDYGIS